jgi:hypothetical protein
VRWLLLGTAGAGAGAACVHLWLAGVMVKVVGPLATTGGTWVIAAGVALWIGAALFLGAAVPLAAAILRPAAGLRRAMLAALVGASISAVPGAMWTGGAMALFWRGLPSSWAGVVSLPALLVMTALLAAPCLALGSLAVCLIAARPQLQAHEARAREGQYGLGCWAWGMPVLLLLPAVYFVLGGARSNARPELPPHGNVAAALADYRTRDATIALQAEQGESGVVPLADFVVFWWPRRAWPDFDALALSSGVANEVLPEFARVQLADPGNALREVINALPLFGYRGRVELVALLRRDPWRRENAWARIRELTLRQELTVNGTMPNEEVLVEFAANRVQRAASADDVYWAIAALADCSARAAPILQRLSREAATASHRALAIVGLGRLAKRDAQLVPAIADCLADGSPEVRAAAADALGRLKAGGRPARSRLTSALQTERDPTVIRRLRWAIQSIPQSD